MKTYKGFFFWDTYDLEDYIPIMYDELTSQFDERVQKKGYFKSQCFGLWVGDSDEKIYTNPQYEGYYFLDVKLEFPPQSYCYVCTICWKKNEQGVPSFYWTSNFPQSLLEKYVKRGTVWDW
ncbi:MAG: hypothetical protein FWH36_04190 [Lentimicrobiaceae bacterium]|nr:hypothetical protein [Lentimicrobiaceae bacterium]